MCSVARIAWKKKSIMWNAWLVPQWSKDQRYLLSPGGFAPLTLRYVSQISEKPFATLKLEATCLRNTY